MKREREQSRAAHLERRKRFGVLMVAIIATFAIQGVATPGPWEQTIVAALLGATVVLSLSVAEARVALIRRVTVLAGALVIVSSADALFGDGNGLATRLANLLLVTLAPPAILVGIIRTLRVRNRVTI